MAALDIFHRATVGGYRVQCQPQCADLKAEHWPVRLVMMPGCFDRRVGFLYKPLVEEDIAF